MSAFSVHDGSGDVETLMGAVADAVHQWESGAVLPLDLSMIQDRSKRLAERARQLTFQWNVDGNAVIHSTRPGMGPWIIRFQTLVRRLTWWFLEPVLLQIRLFQMNAANVVADMALGQEMLAARFTATSQEDWKKRIETLETQVRELQQRIRREGGDAG
jgi:hypothetical protein